MLGALFSLLDVEFVVERLWNKGCREGVMAFNKDEATQKTNQ